MPLTPRTGHAKGRDRDANAVERLPAKGFDLVRHSLRDHDVRVRRETPKRRDIREADPLLPRVQEYVHGALGHPCVRHRWDGTFNPNDFGARMHEQTAAEPRGESPNSKTLVIPASSY